MFRWTENAVYVLRRYDDEFLARHKPLSDLIATLQGMCFDRFSRSPDYARAYLLNRTLFRLYGNRHYIKKGVDPVRDALSAVNAHHDLSRPMSDYVTVSEMRAWDIKGMKAKTPKARLKLFFEIAGRRFHYEHQFVKVLQIAGIEKPKQVKKLRKTWTRFCVESHKKDDAERREQFRSDRDSEVQYAIHGFLDK